jgi:ABC-type oligopeptide transport system substrate-binding subunit
MAVRRPLSAHRARRSRPRNYRALQRISSGERRGSAARHRGNFAHRVTSAVRSGDYPSPQDFLSEHLVAGAEYNRGQVHLPVADALLNRADAEPDVYDANVLYGETERVLLNCASACPLVAPPPRNWEIDGMDYPANEVWIRTYRLYR